MVDVLVGQAFKRLDLTAQQVLQVLAVFPEPAPPPAVDFVLRADVPTIDSAPVLRRSANMHFARPDQGRYSLHPVDRAYAIAALREQRLPGTAAVLAEISEYLQRWGHTRLAFELHRRLVGRLTEPWQMTANLGNLGLCYRAHGDLDAAIEQHTHAVAIDRLIGDRRGQAIGLGNLGLCYYDRGDFDTAIDYCTEALGITRDIGYRKGEAIHLGNLANCFADRGDLDRAIEHNIDALAIARDIGHRSGEAHKLCNLGDCSYAEGDLDAALGRYAQAAAIASEAPAIDCETESLLALAQISLQRRDRAAAMEWMRRAAEGDYEPRSHERALLQGMILLAHRDRPGAAASFARAAALSDQHHSKGPTRYGPLDIRGLALAGLVAVGEPAQLHAAVDSFRQARSLTRAPGIVAAVQRRLDLIASLAGQELGVEADPPPASSASGG